MDESAIGSSNCRARSGSRSTVQSAAASLHMLGAEMPGNQARMFGFIELVKAWKADRESRDPGRGSDRHSGDEAGVHPAAQQYATGTSATSCWRTASSSNVSSSFSKPASSMRASAAALKLRQLPVAPHAHLPAIEVECQRMRRRQFLCSLQECNARPARNPAPGSSPARPGRYGAGTPGRPSNP